MAKKKRDEAGNQSWSLTHKRNWPAPQETVEQPGTAPVQQTGSVPYGFVDPMAGNQQNYQQFMPPIADPFSAPTPTQPPVSYQPGVYSPAYPVQPETMVPGPAGYPVYPQTAPYPPESYAQESFVPNPEQSMPYSAYEEPVAESSEDLQPEPFSLPDRAGSRLAGMGSSQPFHDTAPWPDEEPSDTDLNDIVNHFPANPKKELKIETLPDLPPRVPVTPPDDADLLIEAMGKRQLKTDDEPIQITQPPEKQEPRKIEPEDSTRTRPDTMNGIYRQTDDTEEPVTPDYDDLAEMDEPEDVQPYTRTQSKRPNTEQIPLDEEDDEPTPTLVMPGEGEAWKAAVWNGEFIPHDSDQDDEELQKVGFLKRIFKKKKKKRRSKKKDNSNSGFIKRLLGISIGCFMSLIVAAMALSYFVDSTALTLPRQTISSVVTPVQQVVSGFFQSITQYMRTLKIRGDIEFEYEQMLQELDTLTTELAFYRELEIENSQLYDLLEENNNHQNLNPLSASVIGTDASNYFSTLTLDKGWADGVTDYMAVVSNGGLVGVTYNTTEHKCEVRCIINDDCTVAALVQSTRDQGSVKGCLGSTGKPLCRMYYLPENALTRPGDTIVTSGVGLEFPKGIPIGYIRESTRGMEENKSYVVIEPIVDFQHLERVTIYRYRPLYAEEAQTRTSSIITTYETVAPAWPVPTFQVGEASDFLFSATAVPDQALSPVVSVTPTPASNISPAPSTTPNANGLGTAVPASSGTQRPENLSYATPDNSTPSPTPRPTEPPTPTPVPTYNPMGMTLEED